MKIKVRTQLSGDIDVDIPDSSRVSALRPIVAERTGLDASLLRFIFHGHLLDDKDKLADRGVDDGKTVIMVTRRPPGAADDTSSRGETGGTARRVQQPTTNLVNAEINIMRTGFLEERENAVNMIRGTVEQFVTPLSTSLTWEVDSRENLPQSGDLTILVRLLGNEINHPSSGARARILRITDLLSRIILAMQVIRDDLCQMVEDIVGSHYTVDDETFARLDECVLRLEETLLVPRNGFQEITSPHVTIQQEPGQLPASAPSTPANAEGRPASAPETVGQSSAAASRNVTRHSARQHYAQLLDHVIATQTDFSTQIAGYQSVLRNPQIFCSNEYTRCVAQVFQEHTRRMFHCFGHIFHILSDISSSFDSAEPDHLRPVVPESESPFRTEAIFRIIALTGEESRIRNLGQQAARAFQSASQPSPLRNIGNVRMHVWGDVRIAPRSGAPRFPNVTAVGSHIGANQPFMQFPPAGLSGVVGPFDVNLLQRLFAGGSAPTQVFAQPVPVLPPVLTPASPGPSRPPAPTGGPTSPPSDDYSDMPVLTSHTGQRRNNSILRQLFTEALNQLLANRSRTTANAASSNAGTTPATAGTAPSVATPAPVLPSPNHSATGTLTLQAINVPQNRSGSATHSSPATDFSPILGSLVVEADGPEGARQILNAAMQAARGFMVPPEARGESNQPNQASQPNQSNQSNQPNQPRQPNQPTQAHGIPMTATVSNNVIQFRPATSLQIRRIIPAGHGPPHLAPTAPALNNPGIRMTSPNMPQIWHTGQFHTTDRYLPCRSNFASSDAEVNRTRDYQGALRTIREAALRYERSLPESSDERDEAEVVTDRWSALRESDERHSRQILGGNVAEIGTMQNDPEQFKRVLGNILERIVHQMAVTDPDIAEDLMTTRNDFETYFNDLTSENRRMDTGSVPHEVSSSEGPIHGDADPNTPSTSAQGSGALPRVSSEPALRTQNASGSASEGDGARWNQEMQVLRVIADILNAPGGATVGFLNLLITLCCEVLDTTDFMRLLSGDFSTFGNYRQQMRRYIIEHVLDDNSRPSAEDLEGISRRLQLPDSAMNALFEADNSLRRFVDVPDIGRVDISASALNIDRLFVRDLLSLLINTSDGLSPADFAKRLSEMFAGFFRRFVAIANLSTNSPTGYTNLLMHLTQIGLDLSEGMTRAGGTAQTAEAQNEFLLLRNLVETSLPRLESYLNEEGLFHLSNIANELILVDPAAEELSWSSDSAETVIAAGTRTAETTEESDAATLEGGERLNDTSDQPSSSKAAGGSQDSSTLPESWATVIADDVRRQSALPASQGLSAAYLSGDPFAEESKVPSAKKKEGETSDHIEAAMEIDPNDSDDGGNKSSEMS